MFVKSFLSYLIYNRSKNKISSPRFRSRSISSRAFVKCPQRRQNRDFQARLEVPIVIAYAALISLLSRKLLDDCSNTTRSYCTSTFAFSVILNCTVFSCFWFLHLLIFSIFYCFYDFFQINKCCHSL